MRAFTRTLASRAPGVESDLAILHGHFVAGTGEASARVRIEIHVEGHTVARDLHIGPASSAARFFTSATSDT